MHSATPFNDGYAIRLLVRPRAHPDESAKGYLLRAIHANGFHLGLAEFCRCAGIHTSDIQRGTAWLARLLHSSTQPTNTVHESGETIAWRRRMGNTTVCPECLAECGFRRLEWDLPLSVMCLRHKRPLMKCCCQCHKLLRYEAGLLFSCACGQDLRKMVPDSSAGVTGRYLKVLAPWRENLLARWLTDDIVNRELRILDFITASVQLMQHGAMGSDIPRKRFAQVEEIKDFQPLLKNWPASVLSVIEEHYDGLPLLKRSLLTATAREAQLPFIEERLNELARIARKGPWTLRPDPGAPDGAVSLEKVTQALGIARKEARTLFKAGQLAAPADTNTAGRHMPLRPVCRSELTRAWLRRWYSLSDEEAADFLHCSRDWISALGKCGLLTPCTIPPLSSERYLVADTASLVAHLKSRSCLASPDDPTSVCIAAVRPLHADGSTSQGWFLLMDAIRLRSVSLFCHGHDGSGLQNFSVRQADVKRLGCRLAENWREYQRGAEILSGAGEMLCF